MSRRLEYAKQEALDRPIGSSGRRVFSKWWEKAEATLITGEQFREGFPEARFLKEPFRTINEEEYFTERKPDGDLPGNNTPGNNIPSETTTIKELTTKIGTARKLLSTKVIEIKSRVVKMIATKKNRI